MNKVLFNILNDNIGKELTHTLALEIVRASSMIDELIPREVIERIEPGHHEGFIFAVERIENIQTEIMPLHRSHWDETEAHRHGLPFDPDYTTFIRYERAGRYVLFTLRQDGKLVGNCAMYLDKSTHTQTLMSTEDTLYLLPEARTGTVAKQFVRYIEHALRSLGIYEINVTVKTVNRAGLFFQKLGYRHVENGLNKILEN